MSETKDLLSSSAFRAYKLSSDDRPRRNVGSMDFEIIGSISETETIAVGRGIRDLRRLERGYGRGRWRKRKGFAAVLIKDTDETFDAEIHRYEATGIGRKEFKIKRRLQPKG